MKATLPWVATLLALSTLGFVSQPADADSYDRAKRQYNQNLRNRVNNTNSYGRARAQYNWNRQHRNAFRGDAYSRAYAQYDYNIRNRPYTNHLNNINNRQAQLLNQITNGVGNGTLTVDEAARLRQRVHEIDALEQRMMVGGLSGYEYSRLNTALVQLRQQLVAEMNDGQRRWY